MSTKPNSIIYKKHIDIENHVHFKDLKDFINNSDSDYGTIYIIGIETVTMDDILNAILISIYANRVVFCIKPEQGVARILRALGFDVSETYDEYNYIGTQQDLDMIDSSCISKNEEKVRNSLVSGMDTVLMAIQDLISLIKGEKGYFEFSEDTIRIGETIEIFTNTIKEYLNTNVFTQDEQVIGFIRYLSNKYSDVKENEGKLNKEVSALSSTNIKYLETINHLQNELTLLKNTVRFNHFFTYNVDKTNSESKVLYVREYSHCPFLLSFFTVYNMFLKNINKQNVLIVVGEKDKTIPRNSLIISGRTLKDYKIEELRDRPILAIEEPSPPLWDSLLNKMDTEVTVVLDRTKSDVPILSVDKKIGVQLNAVGTRLDIAQFELDPDSVITSIIKHRQAKYCIPVMNIDRSDPNEAFKAKTLGYMNQCSGMYTDISRRLRVIG